MGDLLSTACCAVCFLFMGDLVSTACCACSTACCCLCFLFMGDLVSTACCIVHVFYLRVILCQLLAALFMFSI